MSTAIAPSQNDVTLNFQSDPRAYREAKGLNAHHVAEQMRVLLGEEKRHFTSVTKMERVGSYSTRAIRAYSQVVGVDYLTAIEVFEKLAQEELEKKSNL